jgi:hypothetical protein
MKRNKYNVSPADARRYYGRTYASKAEMEYAKRLDYLVAVEDVLEWLPQVRFTLGVPENIYVVDFLVLPSYGAPWCVDVKGVETPAFKRNCKLWASYGRLDLHIIKRRGDGFETKRIIQPAG